MRLRSSSRTQPQPQSQQQQQQQPRGSSVLVCKTCNTLWQRNVNAAKR